MAFVYALYKSTIDTDWLTDWYWYWY